MGSVRILIADDSAAVRLLVKRAFEGIGWEVVPFQNGYEAYEAGLDGGFDLAFVDHFMPGMLGAEILQGWRDEDVDIPVIMLSGLDNEDMIVTCLELGARDFIRKPFNSRELEIRARLHLRLGTSAG